MTAVLMYDSAQPRIEAWLEELRRELGRRPGDTLHFQNLRSHGERLHVAQALGKQTMIITITVVVCKEHLARTPYLNDDRAYLYTFRFLLERISWLARDMKCDVKYTLAHIHRFKISRLREYESVLRAMGKPECTVEWEYVDPKGGSIDQPSRVPGLQVADLAVSSIAQAFEPDRFGNTEQRYLLEIKPRIWARGQSANRYTAYGLKMHPWSNTTKAAYPWVAAL